MTPKKKILLVDDEKGITFITKINLEKTGQYEVETENDSTQALSTARRFRPDIIILDMIMPRMDGGDVKRQIVECPQLKDTPILFLSALVSKADTSSDAQVVQSGEDIMIPKPVTTELLIQCIETQLSGGI